MKKFLLLLLCASMLLGLVPSALAQEASDKPLVVGSTTPMSGDFFTDMWGNNTSDMDVRSLINGYNTVSWNGDGNYAIDATAVKDTKITEKGGNKTYQFTLNEKLKFSDGTPITAKDYVFSVLLLCDPRMTCLGAVPSAMQQLSGIEAYQKGVLAGMKKQEKSSKFIEIKTPFAGVRYINDLQFSVTVQKKYLPYFYELTLVNIQPYPLHIIAPECDVVDKGKGAYITGSFSTELLEETVLNPETGYRFHPKVTSGPYLLDHFDAETRVATLSINPEYLGNFEGQKPTIQRLLYRYADMETMQDELLTGELDLAHKVTNGDKIEAMLAISSKGELSASNYPRTGYASLSFACEAGATQQLAVRQAVLMCVDLETLCRDYLKGYGLPVYAYYGLGQWMVSQVQEQLISLASYTYSVNGARALLVKDGWIYNADGSPYNDMQGGIRCRKVKGGYEQLVLRWALPEESDVAAQMAPGLIQNLESIGVRVEKAVLPFEELLQHYYRQVDRAYDMFFMATNFTLTFDPYDTYNIADEYQGVFNVTGLRDKKLMELAENMRRTEPNDRDSYQEKWLAFQRYWVKVLPTAPLYTNIYFDFYRTDLQQYRPNSNWSWGNAILYAYLGEPQADPAVAGMPLGGQALEEVPVQ